MFAREYDVTSSDEMRPESVDDISFCLCRIMSKVRIPPLRPFTDLVAWDECRTFDFEVKLKICSECVSSTDIVRFRAFRVIRSSLVGDRELISFARTSVEARRWSDEIGDVNRLPDFLLCCWIVDLTYELNSGPWPATLA